MDLEDTLLMMPGPVTVTPRVLRDMSKPMINHRSAEFVGIYTDCREILSTIQQLEVVLSKRGYIDSLEAGIEAATRVLDRA